MMCCNVLKYILFSYLASGSGDTTVRFWDVTTETPHHVCRGIFHLSMKAVFGIYNQTALISSAQLLLQAINKHICVQENFRRFLNTMLLIFIAVNQS